MDIHNWGVVVLMNIPNFIVEQVTRLWYWVREQYWWVTVFFRAATKQTTGSPSDHQNQSVMCLECVSGSVRTRDASSGAWYEVDYRGLEGRVLLPANSWITIPDGMRLQPTPPTIRIRSLVLSYDPTMRSVTITGRIEDES